MTMTEIDKLFTQGFYFGKIKDLVLDYSEFLNKAHEVRELVRDKSKWCFQNVTNDESLPHLIPAQEKEKRLKIIKDRNLTVSLRVYQLISDPQYQHFYDYFDNIAKKLVLKMYPTLNDNNILLGGFIQLFENDDYLDTHTDGYMNGYCTIVIYLSDIQNYNGSGKLVIEDFDETCDPIIGNYSVFEMTKNDVRHRIDKVTENFQRLSYLIHVRKN